MKFPNVGQLPKIKQKRINIKKYQFSNSELKKLGDNIRENLGDEIFEFKTMDELLYHVLRQISPYSIS